MTLLPWRRPFEALCTALLLLPDPTTAWARPLRIKRVALRGLHTAPMSDLLRAVRPLLPAGPQAAARRRAVMARVKGRLMLALRELGYLAATVRIAERQPGEWASFVVLRALVREGHRFRVGALDVTGLSPVLRLRALAHVKLRSGQYLLGADLRRSAEGVATVVADLGHAFVKVKLIKTRHRSKPLLDVTFSVSPGPLVNVGRVEVRGASPTASLLVRRALLLHRGSRYHRTRLRQALARLRRTGAFKAITISEAPMGKGLVRLIVSCVQARP